MESNNANNEGNDSSKNHSSRVFWEIFFGVASLALLVFGGIGLFLFNIYLEISAPVNNQLTALRGKDLTAAYKDYSSKDFRAAVSPQEFAEIVDMFPAFKNNEDFQFQSFNIAGETGNIEGTLRSQSGNITPVRYHLVKEGENWKIQNIHFNPNAEEDEE
jgi:hypothetical protein